jgi:hypothetical protein
LNRRVLYIVIVVAVLILGGILILPRVLGGGAKPAATAGRTAKGAGSDSTKAVKGRTSKRAVRGKAAAQTAEATPAAPAELSAAPLIKDSTPAQWVGDPFVRDWLMAGELRDMKLRAVTIGAKSLALINDRIVAKGDTINGKRVTEITRDSVVFEFGGQRRGLKIGE